MEEVYIKGSYIELIKLLKHTGVVMSGSEAKQLVDEGMVKVDDKTEHRKRAKLTENTIVEVGERKYIIKLRT